MDTPHESLKTQIQELEERLAGILGVNPDDPEATEKIKERANKVGELNTRRARLQGELNVLEGQDEARMARERETGAD